MPFFTEVKNTLLGVYSRYMHVKFFVDSDDNELKDAYLNAVNSHYNKLLNHPEMIDAGFDILVPDSDILSKPLANKVDFNIVCACKMVTLNSSYNTGFYMYPRSSISKTPLRLANNVGIIDAGYRGHLIGMFDLPAGNTEHIKKFDKYLQICAPGLVPIFIELVSCKEDLGEQTERGEGGFGSTSSSTF
jgi:dUTP pyrophosphatase